MSGVDRNVEFGVRSADSLLTADRRFCVQPMTPDTCPNCGADVPRNAKACPECGSDEKTGWSDAARYDGLDLPDEEFDYDEFVQREFGGGKSSFIPHGLHWFWWLLTVLLLAAGLAWWFF